jgi:hypothetical protein
MTRLLVLRCGDDHNELEVCNEGVRGWVPVYPTEGFGSDGGTVLARVLGLLNDGYIIGWVEAADGQTVRFSLRRSWQAEPRWIAFA